ncbi:MAG TPA: TetR-like C-terminal domain-containing protein, partial [Spirochaetia bacterium]
AGEAGIVAVTMALRDYVVAHPRRVELLLEDVEGAEGPLRDAAARLLRRTTDLLAGYGLDGVDAIHAARMLRALWIGFSLIQTRGGYALDVPVDESFTWAIELVHRALEAEPPAGAARKERPTQRG